MTQSMSQSLESTPERLGDAPGGADNFDMNATALKEFIDSVLARRSNAAPAANARDADSTAALPPLSTGCDHEDDNLARIVDLPPLRTHRVPGPTLHALQEWEGYVVEIDNTEFVARLVDLTAGASYEEEEATIPLIELSDDDAARMRPGSIFRWVIGYERSPMGTKKRVSHIVFRDLPAMTGSDLRDGRAWARETIRSLKL